MSAPPPARDAPSAPAGRGAGRPLSLRTILTASIVALAAVGFAANGTAILLTTYLHRTTNGLEGAIESVRLAEEMEVGLLTHERAMDRLVRVAIEGDLRQMLVDAQRYVAGARERELQARVGRAVEGYLASARAPARPEDDRRASRSFEVAFGALRELVRVNVEQSRALRDRAARWDRIGNLLGWTLVGLVVLGVAVTLFWLRAFAFRPAFELRDVLERYAKGERGVRAPETGPSELADIGRRFNETADALSQQSERQLAFLAGVAHDLRSPLTALKMSMDAVGPEAPLPPEPRIRQAFARVQRQIERLDRMVWDLLDAARIEAGELELRPEPCELRELVRAVLDLFEAATAKHQLVLSVPDQPVTLRCDATRVEQVLGNLVSNAIKYSPAGGRIEVEVARQEREVLLSVSDQGIGIAPDEVARLFEPFSRTGSSRETVPGVGLGLFVARRIVEAHGGRIEIESSLGHGSTFRVHLPLVAAPQREPRPGAPPEADEERRLH